MKVKKIVIAAPIYPPEIGGPAQYAFHLEQEFRRLGHQVRVVKFAAVRHWPTGLRHLIYFFKLLPAMVWADWAVALDTFSVALPAMVVAKLVGTKIVIRAGGDFLWEWYVERTGDLVLLQNFYQTRIDKLSVKERIVFWLTGYTICHVDRIIFSTDWQRRIWLTPYQLKPERCSIVENYYGPKEVSYPAQQKTFLAGTRPLKWKNSTRLTEAFRRDHIRRAAIVYDDTTVPFDHFMDKLAHCYAIVLVSLGDVSPNMILDAIRHNKPFILSHETGLYDRLKEVGIFVDPENVDEIAEKILWLADEKNYQLAKQKIEQFTFTHTWAEIATEFVQIFKNL